MVTCLICRTPHPTWHSLIGHLFIDHNLAVSQARLIGGPPTLEQVKREWGRLDPPSPQAQQRRPQTP